MSKLTFVRAIFSTALLAFGLFSVTPSASAQIAVGISVHVGPPALPVYAQPICPTEGYLWTPGYWAYNAEGGYYWVPGVWVAPPRAGLLWTLDTGALEAEFMRFTPATGDRTSVSTAE